MNELKRITTPLFLSAKKDNIFESPFKVIVKNKDDKAQMIKLNKNSHYSKVYKPTIIKNENAPSINDQLERKFTFKKLKTVSSKKHRKKILLDIDTNLSLNHKDSILFSRNKNRTNEFSLPKIANSHFFQATSQMEISGGTEEIDDGKSKIFQKLKTYLLYEDSCDNIENIPNYLHKNIIKDPQKNFFCPVTNHSKTKIFPQKLSKMLKNNQKGNTGEQVDFIRKFPKVKFSPSQIGDYIKSYAVNSYIGKEANSNEDKVSIILSIVQPNNYKDNWPQCSFLAIFDGYNGRSCSSFLRDNLHHYIIKSKYFPHSPEKALIAGFKKANDEYIKQITLKENDKSGSSAIVALILDNIIYIANSGNSRAIISSHSGRQTSQESLEHNSSNASENKRIVNNGENLISSIIERPQDANEKEEIRISPRNLRVSKSIGNLEVKVKSSGGKKGVIIPTPEIRKVYIDKNIDFLLLCTYSIVEMQTHEECVKYAWKILNRADKNNVTLHSLSGSIVDGVIKRALQCGANDNLTAIFIGFQNFAKSFEERDYILKGNNKILTLSYRKSPTVHIISKDKNL